MAESFEQLRLEFLAETEETLEALQRDLNRLGEAVGRGAPEPAVVDRVFRTTHSLKGVAGMFGLDEMSAVSHAMESVFDQLRDGRLPFDGTVLDLLYQGNESLHRLLAHASGRTPTAAAGAEDVILEVERHLEKFTPAVEDAPDGDPLAAALPHLASAEQDALRKQHELGANIAVVEASFDEVGFEQPFRELLDRVREWGTVHGTVPGNRDEDQKTFQVRVVASGPGEAFALMRAVGSVGAEVLTCEPERVFVRPAEAPEPQPKPETEPEPKPEPTLGREPPVEPSAPAPSAVETLRVPVHRVDRLLSELGDLIQAKLGLDNTALEILEASQSRIQRTTLIQALRNLDRRIRVLQDEILRVRMVSLGATFQMLERTVRETCRITGKEAVLVTSGDRVELDKRVVESLTEPLVHLVRNAVDHGLEAPDVRAERGKPRVGTVRIDARPRGGHTLLEVSDDGGGLDLERIERKARSMGLVRDGETTSRADLLDVIFHPGFTVKEEATSVSGRGVGLDAVRAAVAELGGMLSVDTGLGSTFRLRIPTSLAIAKALLVEAAGQEFFVPLASVDRVGNVRTQEIERVAGDEVFVSEHRVTPVADLAGVLGLPLPEHTTDAVPAVFLGLAEKRLLLRVDRLGGQQEIVVRSLGDLLPAVPGVAAATELGDGRTVLILDPAALFELARKGKPAGVAS